MQAKGIVCKHNNMYGRVLELEEEVRVLEEQQTGMVQAKEAELFGEVVAARMAQGLALQETEVARAVKRRVGECVAGVGEGRGYSLTRVGEDQNNNQQHPGVNQSHTEAKQPRLVHQHVEEKPGLKDVQEPTKDAQPATTNQPPSTSQSTATSQPVPPSSQSFDRSWQEMQQSVPHGLQAPGERRGLEGGKAPQQKQTPAQLQAQRKTEEATMLEHINRQIERSMRAAARPTSAQPNMESRLTQVTQYYL